jgi:hypothetical protein
MREEAALAHAELLGERADGEALEALRGSDINGAGEDGFASAQSFGLEMKDGLAEGLFGALAGRLVDGLGGELSAGTGAHSDGH